MISAEAKHYSNKITEDLFTLRARKKGRGWAKRTEDTVAKFTQGELAELLAKAFESGASKKVEEYEGTLNVIASWGEGADKLSSRWDEPDSALAAREVLRKMGGVPSEGETHSMPHLRCPDPKNCGANGKCAEPDYSGIARYEDSIVVPR